MDTYIFGFSVGIALIIYGVWGIKNKKIFPIGALSGTNRYHIDMGKGKSFNTPTTPKDYLVRGTWALLEGLVYILIGLVIIINLIYTYPTPIPWF